MGNGLDKSVKDIMDKAIRVMRWVHKNTTGLALPNEGYERYGYSLLQHSLNIGDGIVCLIDHNLPGPAHALARPLLESFARGTWLLVAATDEQIERIAGGDRFPGSNDLLEAIETSGDYVAAWLRGTAELNRNDFHDLTHGGIQQMARNVSEDAIEPNYSSDETCRLLRMEMDFQMITACTFFERVDDEERVRGLFALRDEVGALGCGGS